MQSIRSKTVIEHLPPKEIWLKGKVLEKKNIPLAVKYYQLSIDKGYEEAQEDLDRLLGDEGISACDANLIGVMFHNADGVTRDYAKAMAWYKKAEEKGSANAIRNIGVLYEIGEGVIKNIRTAAKFYQLAIEKGFDAAQTDLDDLLANDEISFWDTNLIGVMFHNADGVTRDYAKAMAWYKKAEEKGSANAIRNIGVLYEIGGGVIKNIKTAAKFYQLAIDKGFDAAQTDLDDLLANEEISAWDANSIGVMFHNADGVTRDYAKAMAWYKKAADEGSATALYNIGILYEHNQGVSQDLMIAAKYYREAILKGYQKAKIKLDNIHNDSNISRDHMKALERERIILFHQMDSANFFRKKLFDEKDSKDDTALHRTAKRKMLKHCSRLWLMGSSIENKNNESKTPFEYLTSDEKSRVTKLRSQLNRLITNLRTSPPTILFERFNVQGQKEVISLADLNELYIKPEIKPLMELAKLAALGMHNLSKTKRVIEGDGYDSDNDEALSDDHKLQIDIDASQATVEGLVCWGEKGDKGKDAHGVYFQNGSSIYVGGKVDHIRTLPKVKGTLFHELTHFIVYEVFKNACKPYEKRGIRNRPSTNEIKFTKIIDELEKNQDSLDSVLTDVFRRYKKEKYHNEFIVRVPQMIIQYPDGLERLKAQAPKLLEYYLEIFLPALLKHTKKLLDRALGQWPLEVFPEAKSNEISQPVPLFRRFG